MAADDVQPRVRKASLFPFLLVILSLLTFLTSAFVFHRAAFCAQVTLAWDPVNASDLAGYKVHYGTVTRNYSFTVDAGTQTTATVTDLTEGVTYYFAATAYSTTGSASGPSNEVIYPVSSSCTSTIAPTSKSFTAAGGTENITVTTPSACIWTAVSPVSWITITSGASGIGTGTVTYSVLANTGSSSRTAGLTIAGAVFTVTQTDTSSYIITASAGAGGAILPAGMVTARRGISQGFMVSPANGYRVADVTVDGLSLGEVTSYTFINVMTNHTISASFASTGLPLPTSLPLTITKTGTGSGTVTTNPSGTSFPGGTSVTLTAAPDTNSNFTGWSGGCSGTGSTCTIVMNGATSVGATFTLKSYTITASGGTNGTISPGGQVTAAQGTSRAFTITPANGYKVATVTVDGSSVGAVTSYTFTNVTANHTISASFAATSLPLTITKTGTGSGTVTTNPSGTSFPGGTSVTLTAAPDTNSNFTGWSGGCSGTGSTCTITMNGATSVTATFTLKSYTITASGGANGTISPSGQITISQGISQSFTITPANGYKVATVTVDGSSVGAVTSYAFTNVTANHTISAAFAIKNTYVITTSPGANGTISPANPTVSSGASVTFSISPAAGYRVSDVKVDGISRGVVSFYTFTNVTATHTISATFAPNNAKTINILWRNTATGENTLWYMNGTTLAWAASVDRNADQNWNIVGIADFNNDGQADILWRNTATGENCVWRMYGATWTGYDALSTVADPNWNIVGVADFNNDGQADILWRNTATGENTLWYMNGTTTVWTASLATVADPNWNIVGVADFNNDGQADILWRNTATGENTLWYMNGTTIALAASLDTNADPNWNIVGVADFNNDGQPDILWQHQTTGQLCVWMMNRTIVTQRVTLNPGAMSDTNWEIVGAK